MLETKYSDTLLIWSLDMLQPNNSIQMQKILHTKFVQTHCCMKLIRVFTGCHSTGHFKRQMHKKQNLGQNTME